MRLCHLILPALLAVAPATAAEPIRVSGQVVQTLAGLRVELYPAWEDHEQAVRRLEAAAELKPLASVRPDAQGRFVVQAPESGAFRLVVRAEGRVAMAHPLVALVEDTALPGVILPIPEERNTWYRAVEDSSGWWPADLEAGNGPARVRVEVRDASGKPLPGAVIRQGGRVLARTGPDGRAEVAFPAKESSLIVESRDGGRARLERPAGGQTPVVRPQPPRTLAGRVVDAVSKRPLAGALVWIGRPPVAPVVRTGDDGTFQIAVPAGEQPFLEAAAAGYVPISLHRVEPGGKAPAILALEPSATLEGVVVDGTGRPLPGARIMADPPRDRVFQTQTIEAWSGDGGHFRLTGLRPAGTYRVQADHEDFARTEVTAPTAPAGQPSRPVRIVLGEGQTASGRMVDEHGRPVAGVRLMLFRPTGEAATEVSDEEGKFRVRGLTPGGYQLVVVQPGASPVNLPGIEIPPGRPVVDLGDVELPSRAGIEGRVVDVQGAPVAGASISALLSFGEGDNFSFGDSHEIQTAADGSFSVPGLQRGVRYDVTVRHPKYVEVTVPGIETPAAEPVRVVLRPGRSLTGKVAGPEGEPIAGASLEAVEELHVGGGTSHSTRSLAITDSEGRFVAHSLAPGVLTLRVHAEGYLSRRIDGLVLPEDRDLGDQKIVLERGVQLDIQVLSAEGEPIPETMVVAAPDPGSAPRHPFEQQGMICSTDPRGRCRIAVPGAGMYTVRVMARGLAGVAATARVEAAGGVTPVEIRVSSGVEVSGRVVDEDGVPHGYASIELTSGHGSSGVAAQPDGSFRLLGVADGRYRLKAVDHLRENSSASLEIVVAGRPVRDLELRIQKGGAGAVLTGRVLGLEPAESRSVSVDAYPEAATAGGVTRPGRIDARGEYRIQDLDAGDWMVQATTMTGRRVEASLRIEPGMRTASLDLQFPPRGPRLSGRVLLDGAPFSGAMVQGRRGSEAAGQVRTAHDGSFALDLQEPGAVTLLIGGPQGIGAAHPVQLADDSEVTVEIRTGRLRGTVTGPAGEPVEGAVLRVEGWSPELQVALAGLTIRSGPDGAFEIPRLAAGLVRISALAQGFAATEALTEVPPGGEGVVEIHLGARDQR